MATATATANQGQQEAPLTGMSLIVAAIILAMANFLVILDTTIANVSVPNIAGGLAISPSQGTWVITSYAVADAIMVPLTGWLASRFGSVKVFTTSMLGFGICSALCGLSPNLTCLVIFRIAQGLCGGTLIPLSQTLLLRVFPPNKAPQAMGIWSMTTLVAPIMGPILGGVLCDNVGWPSIFYINVPIALAFFFIAGRLLDRFETPTLLAKVDTIGLVLLIVWVGALQIMLDIGKEHDWFQSEEIMLLAILAAVGFAAFLIWELTCENPIVDLRVFRHRGFSSSVLVISLAFGAYFGVVVITPLWLQTNMGYTATWAGYAMATSGVLAVIMAPIVAGQIQKRDARIMVFFGVMWLAFMTFVRAHAASNMDFNQVMIYILLQGFGMPFFFIPLSSLALSSVEPQETASAAGLMSFCRTVSGAFATSIVTTVWSNLASDNRVTLAGQIQGGDEAAKSIGLPMIEKLVDGQSYVMATNQIYHVLTLVFMIAAFSIWFAPKPKRIARGGGGH